MKNTKLPFPFYNSTFNKLSRSSFGGSNLKSNPKVKRPFSPKCHMHIVLKAEDAKNNRSFLRYERWIVKKARHLCNKLGLDLKDIVVMGNHIHILARAYSRPMLRAFLRSFAGLIARHIGVIGFKRFFTGRPFTRIVSLKNKAYKTICNYLDLNRLEKLGFAKSFSRKMDPEQRSLWLSAFTNGSEVR